MALRAPLVVLNHVSTILVYYTITIPSCQTISQYRHTSSGRYLLGDYDKKRDKFIVTDGGDFNFGTSAPCGVYAKSPSGGFFLTKYRRVAPD